MEREKPFKHFKKQSLFFILEWPGQTKVNPSDPWPDHYTESITGSGLKTMIVDVEIESKASQTVQDVSDKPVKEAVHDTVDSNRLVK